MATTYKETTMDTFTTSDLSLVLLEDPCLLSTIDCDAGIEKQMPKDEEKRFVCSCGSRYTYARNLKRHQVTKHGQTSSVLVKKKKGKQRVKITSNTTEEPLLYAMHPFQPVYVDSIGNVYLWNSNKPLNQRWNNGIHIVKFRSYSSSSHKQRSFPVHKIVYEAFSNRLVPDGHTVKHRNRDTTDNRYKNLTCVNQSTEDFSQDNQMWNAEVLLKKAEYVMKNLTNAKWVLLPVFQRVYEPYGLEKNGCPSPSVAAVVERAFAGGWSYSMLLPIKPFCLFSPNYTVSDETYVQPFPFEAHPVFEQEEDKFGDQPILQTAVWEFSVAEGASSCIDRYTARVIKAYFLAIFGKGSGSFGFDMVNNPYLMNPEDLLEYIVFLRNVVRKWAESFAPEPVEWAPLPNFPLEDCWQNEYRLEPLPVRDCKGNITNKIRVPRPGERGFYAMFMRDVEMLVIDVFSQITIQMACTAVSDKTLCISQLISIKNRLVPGTLRGILSLKSWEKHEGQAGVIYRNEPLTDEIIRSVFL